MELSADSIVAAHDGGTVQLGISFHQKWLASAGSDGRLLLRLVEKPVSAPRKHKSLHFAVAGQVGQLV